MRRFGSLLCLVACSTDQFQNTDAASDANEDGVATEAGPSIDAQPVDAPADGPSCLGPGFCATGVASALCADFDEGSLMVGWTSSIQEAPLTLSLTAGQPYVSCPSALEVDVPMITTAPTVAGLTGALLKTLTVSSTAGTHVILDLEALLPSFGGQTSVDSFGFFSVYTSDLSWHVRLERSADSNWWLRLQQGGTTSVVTTPMLNAQLGTWNHMTLDVPVTADVAATSTLTYQNNIDAGTTTIGVTGATTAANVDVTVATALVGATVFSITNQDWKFYYDNVVIIAK